MSEGHLEYVFGATGARWYPTLPTLDRGSVRVRESNNVNRVELWLDVIQPRDVESGAVQTLSVRLDENTVRMLEEQLGFALYTRQGDR